MAGVQVVQQWLSLDGMAKGPVMWMSQLFQSGARVPEWSLKLLPILSPIWKPKEEASKTIKKMAQVQLDDLPSESEGKQGKRESTNLL